MDKSLQEFVWLRAEARCKYCRIPQIYDSLPFEIDHVIAVQHGRATTDENLALACFACNHHKGPNIAGFDSESGAVVPLFHPRRDVWSDHFQWNGPELIATSTKGRVTIHVLAINRDYRVALRRALMNEGVFPTHARKTE